MTESDGPILLALLILIIVGAIVSGLIVYRRQRRQERARPGTVAPGGISLLQEGQTVHIGTPGARDRRDVPVVSPLGQRVHRTYHAARTLQDRALLGDPAEIVDAAANAYRQAVDLADYIQKGRDERREHGIS